MIVIFDITTPDKKISGLLSLKTIELRPGLFIGNLSRRAALQLWEDVAQSHIGDAIFVQQHKNEIGLKILSIGNNTRQPINCDGIHLIIKCNQRINKL